VVWLCGTICRYKWSGRLRKLAAGTAMIWNFFSLVLKFDRKSVKRTWWRALAIRRLALTDVFLHYQYPVTLLNQRYLRARWYAVCGTYRRHVVVAAGSFWPDLIAIHRDGTPKGVAMFGEILGTQPADLLSRGYSESRTDCECQTSDIANNGYKLSVVS
jgi:hypothetical protein